MRYGKLFIYLFTVMLLAAAAFAWLQEPGTVPEQNTDRIFSVLVSSNGETEEIHCWKKESGEYYVFLPSYAQLAQTTISAEQDSVLCIANQPVTEGMSCAEFQLDKAYPLSFTADGSAVNATITFLQSGNVPALYIDVVSGSMDYIHETKGNSESGKIRLYNAEGELDHGGSLESISGRGNSTWEQVKKPYNLKLSSEADLLDMGRAQKWVLLANFTDRSHLRNQIVFDFADTAGLAYSPDSEWVDLYLNGEYVGLYLLCERNEIHPQRVNIPEESSFLVSMEVEGRLIKQEYPYISTQSGVPLRIHQSSVDSDTLTAIWQSVENAILAEDGTDPITGKHWRDLIDVDSWVRKYLVEELFANGDAGALSQYFYANTTDGKIFAGPVWDYDVSMGIGIWQMSVPEAFYAGRPLLYAGMDQPWYYALYQQPEFYSRLTELYETEFRPLMLALLEDGIEDYVSRITQAAGMNQVRWDVSKASAEAENIRAYLTERMAFLDSVWMENEEYCTVVVDLGDGSNAACFAVRPGGFVPELPEYGENPDVLGWYHIGTDEPFDAAQPIYEDTAISLKRLQGQTESSDAAQPVDAEPAETPARRAAPFAVLLLILAAAFFADRYRCASSRKLLRN